MAVKMRCLVLSLLYLAILQSALSQQSGSIPDRLRQKLDEYTSAVPREEIYLHADRDIYVSGEEMWFKLYLIDRKSSKPSFNSSIAYVELLNADSRPVVQKRILLSQGFGSGQVLLPDSLSSGTYTLRAYTSWMKNFLPENCFMKDISIYNSLSDKVFKGKLSLTSNSVKGIAEKAGTSGTDKSINLNINNSRKDSLIIFVETKSSYISENSNDFFVVIQTRGNIVNISSGKAAEGKARVSVSKSSLREGIQQITLFDSNGRPVSWRNIYIRGEDKNQVVINSADSVSRRNKLTVDIEPSKISSSSSGLTNMSISVSPFLKDRETVDIDDYMVFGTEYASPGRNFTRGRKIKEIPAGEIDSILQNDRSNWIDWTVILSDSLPDFRYQFEREEHHLIGQLLTGDNLNAPPSELVFLCKPGKQATFQYARSDKNGNFTLDIPFDEKPQDLILMPDNAAGNYKIRIESSFSDQYPGFASFNDSTRNPLPLQVSDWCMNHQVMRIYGSPVHGSQIKPVFNPMPPVRFYGKPDIELILADYISLPTMQEVFFELLPRVNLKKKSSGFEISISDRVDDSRYVLMPCIMIDGVIIRDAALIEGLDPELVEKIDVIKEKFVVGGYAFQGLVNVITRSGNFSSVLLPDYMVRMSYRVTDPVSSFASPDYSSAESAAQRIPDFRNTIYWNPSVMTDNSGRAKIEFWSSDGVSEYEINLQGIDSEGKLVSVRKTIRLK
jgi:hypothetical protein